MLTARAASAPRIRFETVTREARDVLPRMDVAVFVGFAAAGPLHVPVVVEDAKQYTAIFGADPVLAWDPETGAPTHAHLGPAVRAFFANGGRRCWVIRVAAGSATHNYLPVPGLLKTVRVPSGEVVAREPAFARSRSEGSWSDTLQLQAVLRARMLPGVVCDLTNARLGVPTTSGLAPGLLRQPGAMVRLRFSDDDGPQYWLYARISPVPDDVPMASTAAHYQLLESNWFSAAPPVALDPDQPTAQVECHTAADGTRPPRHFAADDPYAEPSSSRQTITSAVQLRWSGSGQARITVAADAPCSVRFHPGMLLHVTVSGHSAWFVARKLERRLAAVAAISSPPDPWVAEIDGELYWLRDPATAPFDPGSLLSAELVSIDLRVQDPNADRHDLKDVGLTASHGRFWGGLCGDVGRYRPRPAVGARPLVDEARDLVFPLACADQLSADSTSMYIPLGMPSAFPEPVGTLAQVETAPHRDGLASFDAALFLDPDLAVLSTRNLMSEADYLRHLAPRPRPLCGLHAALGFGESHISEEATLIAVPDAVHRHWKTIDSPDVAPVVSIPATVPNAADTGADKFQTCAVPTPTTPVLEAAAAPTATGRFTLAWTGDAENDFRLEEAATVDFESATAAYAGRGRQVELYRPAGGHHFFRVRASRGGQVSGWSNALDIRLAPALVYHVAPPADYQAEGLNAVHRALLRLCAAHGELFAVLGMPQHFREHETRSHIGGLATVFAYEHSPSPLSYGAAYHPWLQCRSDASTIVAMPPDGAALGVLAVRAADRGAWVAPANHRFNTVVALTPPLWPDADVPLNDIRSQPHGFMTLRADTLDTTDPALRLISVRRLLILLRRLALRHGATFAFEPNSALLRGQVQQRFEEVLRGLYDRGALSGAGPAQAYQVSTDAALNTPASVEQGRLLVELRVRPALPMEFITVRLLQRGNQLSVSEGR